MSDGLPIVPHLTSEFYVWLWYTSESREGLFELGGDLGTVTVWVDERLAFRRPEENKVSAVMTGDSPSTTLESRAALAGGKILQEIRLGIRRDEREFYVTLKGPEMHLAQLKLPQLVTEGQDEVLYDRMFLHEEVSFIVMSLFREFAAARLSDEWRGDLLPAMSAWVMGADG